MKVVSRQASSHHWDGSVWQKEERILSDTDRRPWGFAGNDSRNQIVGKNAVEPAARTNTVRSLLSYLVARWRRSSANWFPVLPSSPSG